MAERVLVEILETLRRIEHLLANQTGRAALGGLEPDLPLLPHGRRPAFWQDGEVRDLLTSLHRRVGVTEALRQCEVLFGERRTPSRSSLHRYWINLDQIVRRAA